MEANCVAYCVPQKKYNYTYTCLGFTDKFKHKMWKFNVDLYKRIFFNVYLYAWVSTLKTHNLILNK